MSILVLALLDKRAPAEAAGSERPSPHRSAHGPGSRRPEFADGRYQGRAARPNEGMLERSGRRAQPRATDCSGARFLAQDGSLAQPPQLEPQTRTAAASNPYMRTAAEAALRAVNVCEPYRQLPVEKYEAWREIVMTFDPSKMIR